ncbi:unnamed protein product [Phytomonas sp. EM1]|nr:unnamed protein product [Phytomonas sp. EM1]|eukprot:CCW60617.1 unnamed protein product [Phytomonas sp. isolate EM1]
MRRSVPASIRRYPSCTRRSVLKWDEKYDFAPDETSLCVERALQASDDVGMGVSNESTCVHSRVQHGRSFPSPKLETSSDKRRLER